MSDAIIAENGNVSNRNRTKYYVGLGAGITLVVVLIIFMLFYIIGLVSIPVFSSNVQSEKNSILQEAQKKTIPQQTVLPISVEDQKVRAIQVDYSLDVGIKEVKNLGENLELVFTNMLFPPVTVSTASYVPRIVDSQTVPVRASELIVGDTILWTFYYYPISNRWSIREQRELSQR